MSTHNWTHLWVSVTCVHTAGRGRVMMRETPLGPLTVPTTRFGLYTSICIYRILHTSAAAPSQPSFRRPCPAVLGPLWRLLPGNLAWAAPRSVCIDSKSQNNLFHSWVKLLPVSGQVRWNVSPVLQGWYYDSRSMWEQTIHRNTHLGLFDHARL